MSAAQKSRRHATVLKRSSIGFYSNLETQASAAKIKIEKERNGQQECYQNQEPVCSMGRALKEEDKMA